MGHLDMLPWQGHDGPVIDTREELVGALQEAAEIEHGLMIQYLYAGYGFSPENREIVSIAMMICFCTLVGTLLGWLRLASGSVWPAAIAHGFLNAASILPMVFNAPGAPVCTWISCPSAHLYWRTSMRVRPRSSCPSVVRLDRNDTSLARMARTDSMMFSVLMAMCCTPGPC